MSGKMVKVLPKIYFGQVWVRSLNKERLLTPFSLRCPVVYGFDSTRAAGEGARRGSPSDPLSRFAGEGWGEGSERRNEKKGSAPVLLISETGLR